MLRSFAAGFLDAWREGGDKLSAIAVLVGGISALIALMAG
jgi:hypothetical protein